MRFLSGMTVTFGLIVLSAGVVPFGAVVVEVVLDVMVGSEVWATVDDGGGGVLAAVVGVLVARPLLHAASTNARMTIRTVSRTTATVPPG
ncbi:MAG: hypothetical protein ACLPVY_18515 [Acidimicrobiia bacterium]